MFSIASVLMACTAEGIVASAILMWKGRVVDGYLLINTLGWLPLFAAGVATVWVRVADSAAHFEVDTLRRERPSLASV